MNHLHQRQNRILVLLFLILYSVIPLIGEGWRDFSGNIVAYTCGYLLGAYFGKYWEKIRTYRIPWLSIGLIFLALQIGHICGCLFAAEHFQNEYAFSWYNYFSSLGGLPGIICALGLVLFAVKHPFHSGIINFLALPLMGVYLIHDNYLLSSWIWSECYPLYVYYGRPSFFYIFPLKALLVFLGSAVIDLIRIFAIEKPFDLFLVSPWWNRFTSFFRKHFWDEKEPSQEKTDL